LNDPASINPLKYGSSEADPDPVVALLKLRNEAVALNRYTIEFFDNIGGDLFPFQRIEGAQIEKGCVGTKACCVYVDTIAFMGGGRNEPISIYSGSNAVATKISTQEIDAILEGYTEEQLALCVLEYRKDRNHDLLYVHLPDQTIVFDASTTESTQVPAWYVLTSSQTGLEQYRARFFVRCYDKWIFADPATNNLGTFSDRISSHYGEKVRWEFGTNIMYNDGAGALFHQLELVALTGSVTGNPTISTSYSVDGVTWSADKVVSVGGLGNRAKRIVWYQQGAMRNWRIQRFKGMSDAHLSFIRLEAQLEALAW